MQKPFTITQTAREKRWCYGEYFFGEKDEENRKHGIGEIYWTGAESLELYAGSLLCDTMHGEGEYKWCYSDPDGTFTTYEGLFFANRLHGYGMMSYSDGRVFTGLFYNDLRWGPGIEQFQCMTANVGLWRGNQLARLIWQPDGPAMTPDLTSGPMGPSFLDPFRTVLIVNTKIIGQNNNTVELLKHFGADPVAATKKWIKMYPKYCTDLNSALWHKDLFERQYYWGKIMTLEEYSALNNEVQKNNDKMKEPHSYFAWNNNKMTIHIMKHSYQHDKQRSRIHLNLDGVLNGPRYKFKPASKHELDCRSLLMASYIGCITSVTQLVNEEDVFVDVQDSRGNTPLIYAACGDQIDVIHFLVEAGANINCYNDSCCTPLGVVLLRYLCVSNDVSPNSIARFLLPPVQTAPIQTTKSSEWYIIRGHAANENKAIGKILGQKKSKTSSIALNTQNKSENSLKTYQADEFHDDVENKDSTRYRSLQSQYSIKIGANFKDVERIDKTLEYCFTAPDMMIYIDAAVDDLHKTLDVKPSKRVGASAKKVGSLKSNVDTRKSMHVAIGAKVSNIFTEAVEEKIEMLSRIEVTLCQLLRDGADPLLVVCPQPALLLALKSRSSDIIRHVISHGVDINQKFPQVQDYTALDIVISGNFTTENLELARILLQLGADANRRLKERIQPNQIPSPINIGPTLLHAVLWKHVENDNEETIRNDMIDLLLQYNADPTVLYRGHSAIEAAMMKKLELLDLFICSPATNLNGIINENNQTILMKIFSRDYFKTILDEDKNSIITNLLLYGADPLIVSYDGADIYGNVFEYAKTTLEAILPSSRQFKPSIKALPKKTTKNSEKKLKPISSKQDASKGMTSEVTEYQQSLNLMTECARLLHVRWIQAKLLKELIGVVYRFKHRHWSSIIKEHKNGKNLGSWVSPSRCLEIWGILETTRKKWYSDSIQEKLMCILQFYQKRLRENVPIQNVMRAKEKNLVEADAWFLIKEHRNSIKFTDEAKNLGRAYVKPELEMKAGDKFKICFECAVRLKGDRIITCDYCHLVSFCNLSCLQTNTLRVTDHPCSDSLAEKYRLSAEDE